MEVTPSAMSSQQTSGHVKTLWVREPYLGQVLAGLKTVEVRVGYDNIRRLQPGDRLKLNDRHLFAIRRVGHYADFGGDGCRTSYWPSCVSSTRQSGKPWAP